MACIHTLADNVLGWAKERGILANSTAQKQMLKLVSEMGELSDNLAKGRDVKDDIGDCLVVLTIIAHLSGTSLKESFDTAWQDIKDRKGYLNDSGVFIKESDASQQPELAL